MTAKEKLKAALERQQAIVDAAKDAKRDMSAEEKTEFDTLQKSVDDLKAEIAGAEKGQQEPPKAKPEDTAAVAQRAVEAERKRISEINDLCRDFGIDAGKYVSGGKTVDEVKSLVIEELRKNSAPLHVRCHIEDELDRLRAAASDALLMRAGVAVKTPADGAQDLRGMSLRDLAIDCMVRLEGRNANEMLRMSPSDLYGELSRQFFNPTAAFPAILDETIRKSIVTAYQTVPTTFEAWTSKGSVSDFKSTPDHQYLLGGLGDFELVPENGELKHSTLKTSMLPQRKIDTYGKQFSMSRQAFINDDIGFLSAMPAAYTQAAKKTIDKAVYKILIGNPKIFDNKQLFAADHKNLVATGAKPSQATVQEIILLAQGQTDPFDEPIYETPRFLVVPMGYEFDLAVLFNSAQVTGSNNNDVNPLYNYPLTVIQSPWINSLTGTEVKPWFMVTDPASSKSLQVDYLNGNETPTFRRSEAPGQLGFVWDIWHDWGITAVDYRGIYKNPGAKI